MVLIASELEPQPIERIETHWRRSVTIHFCGNSRHLIEPMLEIPGLRGIDFGQAEMMDVKKIYEMA